MPIAVSQATTAETRTWWLLPQKLSLDAPLVAVSWLWLFTHSFAARFDLAECFAIAGAAWLIYALDHILDVRSGALYSDRHRFVLAHAASFGVAALVVFAATLLCIPHLSPLACKAGIIISLVVIAYLAAVHFGGDRIKRFFPKEFVIGSVFAAACSIPAWHDPGPAWIAIALFAALCTLNCAALDSWEWQAVTELRPTPHLFTRAVARGFTPSTHVLGIAALCLYVGFDNSIFLAAAISALVLALLGRFRTRLPIETTRLLADAALLTPLLFLR